MPRVVDGSLRGRPVQTSRSLDFEVTAFLCTPHCLVYCPTEGMRFPGVLRRKGVTLTCFENIGLFLAWMKVTCNTAKITIHNVVWAQSPSKVPVFLVLCLSLLHTFYFSPQKLHRSSCCCSVRLQASLGFCHLSLHGKVSYHSTPLGRAQICFTSANLAALFPVYTNQHKWIYKEAQLKILFTRGTWVAQ